MARTKIPGAVYIVIGAAMILMSVFIDVEKMTLFILVGAVFIVIGFFKIIIKEKKGVPRQHPQHPGQHSPGQTHAAHPHKAGASHHHPSHAQTAHKTPTHKPHAPATRQHEHAAHDAHHAHHTQIVRCASCGVKIHPLFKWCPNCGQKLK